MVPLYLAQMHRLKIDDPDIHHEFMQGNFCVNKNEIPFCAIGPDHAIEQVDEDSGRAERSNTATSSHGKMVPCGARTKSTLRRKLSTWWGEQRASSSHHHDLSDAITNCYYENVQKLKDVLKASDPFATEERHLVNIVTEAVIPDDIKEGVLTRDKIGQALFDTFAQERIVKAKLSVWSPMKKANLKSWKSACQTNKTLPEIVDISRP